MNKPRLSILPILFIWLIGIVFLPLFILGFFWVGRVAAIVNLPFRLIIWTIVMIVLAIIYTFMAYRLINTRIRKPLQHFLSTLEDISEGFIVDEIPDSIFSKAEKPVTDAFTKVIQINHQMLKNVDNLEKGFEEERLAKLHQIALTQAYERFVPHEFLRFLQKQSIIQVQHGDHVKKEMTILFADIRSFTTLSERISAEENFSLLNSYFMRMEPIVQNNGGFIDKFIGDGIMALFYQGPDSSIVAAIEMMAALKEYNQARENAGYEAIRTGVGINTGSLMLGIVGGRNRMEGTVISDAVNVASRIEDLNKVYDTSILISEFTYNQILAPEKFSIRLIDKVEVKGKAQPLFIYEIYDADPEAMKVSKQNHQLTFEAAVRLYHQDDIHSAMEAFSALIKHCPEDTIIEIYLKRCKQALIDYRLDHNGKIGGAL